MRFSIFEIFLNRKLQIKLSIELVYLFINYGVEKISSTKYISQTEIISR